MWWLRFQVQLSMEEKEKLAQQQEMQQRFKSQPSLQPLSTANNAAKPVAKDLTSTLLQNDIMPRPVQTMPVQSMAGLNMTSQSMPGQTMPFQNIPWSSGTTGGSRRIPLLSNPISKIRRSLQTNPLTCLRSITFCPVCPRCP